MEERKFVPQVETLTWGGKLETKTQPKLEHNDGEDEDNRSETSSSVEAETTANAVARKSVVDLACSLLQLAQSVETKYLKKPLGKSLFRNLLEVIKFNNYFQVKMKKKEKND